MQKIIVLGFLFALLSMSMLASAFPVECEEDIPYIVIRADGSIKGPLATPIPISTIDNVTYTLTGNITFDPDIYAEGIIFNRDNIVFDGNGYVLQGSIGFHGDAIFVTDRQNVTIKNVQITGLDCGISITYETRSKYITIVGSSIDRSINGIIMSGSCYYYNISGNTITNNSYGIFMGESYGISIGESCYYNNISGNTITNNSYGIMIGNHSFDNYVTGNNIANNDVGIWLDHSSGSIYLHNNIIDNGVQVYSENSTNIWDDGWPSYGNSGNYWSDYAGVDANGDGIGDTPYIIDASNQDRYPLMHPWAPTPRAVAATVDIYPQTLNLRSKGKWITFYIELPKGYDVNDINVSSILLNNTVHAKRKSMIVGDHDSDGVPDLIVKFNREEVIRYILGSDTHEKRFVKANLTLTGKLDDGTPFHGSDTIRIIAPFHHHNHHQNFRSISRFATNHNQQREHWPQPLGFLHPQKKLPF